MQRKNSKRKVGNTYKSPYKKRENTINRGKESVTSIEADK